MQKIKFVSVVGAAALTLSACSGLWTTHTGSPDNQSPSDVGSTPSAPADPSSDSSDTSAGGATGTPYAPELEKYYTQGVEWQPCDDDEAYECATIDVPVNYNDPDGESIEVAMLRVPAQEEAIGSLLINPGGPGGSGIEFAKSVDLTFGQRVLDSYDIIGFDPRGVDKSSPVECLDSAGMIEMMEATYPDTAEGEQQAKEDTDEYVKACSENTGERIKYVGTREAAQDMDIIRELVGDPKLNYMGFSYGTSLGGTYAELFPQNVGRMVLDGAVDSSVSAFDQNLQQLKGFELATNNYLDDCLAGDTCPFTGTRDEARQDIVDLFEKTEVNPIPTTNPDRPLTQTALVYGYITPLYDDTLWPYLNMAFNQVFEENDGSLFQFLFDAYMGIDPVSGELMNNQITANGAINCADTIVEGDAVEWEKQSDIMAEEAPLLGPIMGYSQYMCSIYPNAEDSDPVTNFVAEGSDPIIVIGTTGDPATPYEWSVAFEEKLDNGVLLTYEGEGHTAYGRAGACIEDAVDSYMVDGTVPEDGKVCQ